MNLAQKGTIKSIKQIAKRTIEVKIKAPSDFSFRAGQYIWLMLPELKYPDKRGNTRMFSIASSPNQPGELDILFRVGESGFKKTLMAMPSGAEVIFSGPYGQMKLPEEISKPIILIAGGVGVAPFLSMIRLANETRSGHHLTLIYANTSEGETAYLDELRALSAANANFKLFATFGLLTEKQLKKLINGYIGQKVIWSVIGSQSFVTFVGRYLNKKMVSLKEVMFEQFYPKIE